MCGAFGINRAAGQLLKTVSCASAPDREANRAPHGASYGINRAAGLKAACIYKNAGCKACSATPGSNRAAILLLKAAGNDPNAVRKFSSATLRINRAAGLLLKAAVRNLNAG